MRDRFRSLAALARHPSDSEPDCVSVAQYSCYDATHRAGHCTLYIFAGVAHPTTTTTQSLDEARSLLDVLELFTEVVDARQQCHPGAFSDLHCA